MTKHQEILDAVFRTLAADIVAHPATCDWVGECKISRVIGYDAWMAVGRKEYGEQSGDQGIELILCADEKEAKLGSGNDLVLWASDVGNVKVETCSLESENLSDPIVFAGAKMLQEVERHLESLEK